MRQGPSRPGQKGEVEFPILRQNPVFLSSFGIRNRAQVNGFDSFTSSISSKTATCEKGAAFLTVLLKFFGGWEWDLVARAITLLTVRAAQGGQQGLQAAVARISVHDFTWRK